MHRAIKTQGHISLMPVLFMHVSLISLRPLFLPFWVQWNWPWRNAPRSIPLSFLFFNLTELRQGCTFCLLWLVTPLFLHAVRRHEGQSLWYSWPQPCFNTLFELQILRWCTNQRGGSLAHPRLKKNLPQMSTSDSAARSIRRLQKRAVRALPSTQLPDLLTSF